MKKYKKIWIVILCIVLVGSAFTLSLRRMLSKQERDPLQTAKVLELETEEKKDNPSLKDSLQAGGVAAPGSRHMGEEGEILKEAEENRTDGTAQREETASPQALYAAPAAIPYEEENEAISENQPDDIKKSGVLDAAPVPEAENGQADIKKSAVEADVLEEGAEGAGQTAVISPLTGNLTSNQEEEKKKVSYEEEKSRLADRISNLEIQIASRWKEDTDETMSSKMNAAEYEYETWEKEMAQTIELLHSVLDESAKNKLAEEQIKWKKESDTKAAVESKRYQGSSREALEYTKASSTLTKKRVLQLINTYLEVLQEQETNK